MIAEARAKRWFGREDEHLRVRAERGAEREFSPDGTVCGEANVKFLERGVKPELGGLVGVRRSRKGGR